MNLKNPAQWTAVTCMAAALAFNPARLQAQAPERARISLTGSAVPDSGPGPASAARTIESTDSSVIPAAWDGSSSREGGLDSEAGSASGLPLAPEPALSGANPQREGVPWEGEWNQPPFSRIGIGADVSPLGIGIKGAVLLTKYFDARMLVNFFGYSSGRYEVDGFNVNANLHMRSAGAMADVYPLNSIWRLSAGLMFFNGNQISTTANIVPGTSFTLGPATYYSSKADPLAGSASLGLDTIKAEPMASFGFGKFIPRSNRHWSFPAEFGVIYMGAPSLTVTTTGSVCTNVAQTKCASISDATNPVAIAFHQDLQTELTKWRKDLNKVQFYPIFSVSVMYSFNIR